MRGLIDSAAAILGGAATVLYYLSLLADRGSLSALPRADLVMVSVGFFAIGAVLALNAARTVRTIVRAFARRGGERR